MGMRVPSSFHEHCATLTDPRGPCAPKSRHLLMDILVMAVCAVMRGAEGWEDIEEYGKANAEWLGDLLDVPHGMPGHETFRRVVSHVDPEELPQCCIAWTHALRAASGGALVSLDGTTRRHAFEKATATAAIPMVRAWARANHVVLGPLKGAETSHAMTAMPALRRLLDVTGAVVTIDAMGCQQEMAKTMTDQGADAVFALQDNHPTRAEEVALWLNDARATGFADLAPA